MGRCPCPQDVVAGVVCDMVPTSVACQLSLKYADQQFALNVDFANKGTSLADRHYVCGVQLTHPDSQLDVTVTAELGDNAQKMWAALNGKYMMSRQGGRKNAKLVAIYKKQQPELKVEVSASRSLLTF